MYLSCLILTRDLGESAKSDLEILSKIPDELPNTLAPSDSGDYSESSTSTTSRDPLPRPSKRTKQMIQKSSASNREIEVNKNGHAVQSNNQRRQRRTLDGHRCVVLGTVYPEICHIVPHNFNKTPLKTIWLKKSLINVAPLFSLDFDNIITLFASRVGANDRV